MTNARTRSGNDREAMTATGKAEKAEERRDHEGLSRDSIGETSYGQIARDGRGHLYSHEHPVLWGPYPDHVEGIDHQKNVNQAFAGPDEDV